MAPDGEPALGDPVADPMADVGGGAAGGAGGKSSYVPPALRNKSGGTAAVGERMGGKYERDDLATLRVTNVSGNVTLGILGPPCRLHANYVIVIAGQRIRRGAGDARYV